MKTLSFFSKNKAFKQELELLRPRLYRLAFSWTQDQNLADDLTQDALIKAMKNATQLRDPDKLSSWAFGILHNCYRDYFRQLKQMDSIDEHTFVDEHQPETDYEHYSITEAVRKAVNHLPENQRQIITLVDLEGCSYNEVSHILDIPAGTVMSRLCRARKTLANKLLHYSGKNDAVNIRRIK